MHIDVCETLATIPADDWDGLAGTQYPFLRHAFLLAAESTGCVSAATGWSPRHITLRDDRRKLVAAMPLYEKTHSWGEFVFDWSWAQAYQRAGLAYYPKLVSAVPFTPAQSPRLLAPSAKLRRQLLDAACQYARDCNISSLHILFPDRSELPVLRQNGLKLRKDCQFHWHNRNFRSFDQFLATFNANKRKKARQDRRYVREQDIHFRWLQGADLDSAVWSDVYDLISNTFQRRGSLPYFSKDFFVEVSRKCPATILVVLAERNRQPLAAAIFYDSEDVLYGRYWGSDADYNALHFETCYYQGIDYCITRGRKVFEPGTQGEHKISRGFTPVETWSAHWLARPEFSAAIGNYLQQEGQHVDRYIDAVASHSPYKAASRRARSDRVR